MSAARGLALYLALFGAGAAAALVVATREESATQLRGKAEQVQVWGGKPGALQQLSFSSPKLELTLEAHQDDVGRWYSGSYRKLSPPASSAAPASSAEPADLAAPPPSASPAAPVPFVGVTEVGKLAERLAPLMALRRIGPVEDKDAADFGLDKPEGSLKVNLGGTLHELVLGGPTPGGEDRYVRYAGDGAVYAVSGELARSLLFADSRLVEKELHAFEPAEVATVRLSRGEQKRELSKVPDKRDAWATAADGATQDEAASNWMSKLGRVRPTGYVEKPPQAPELVLRAEYLNERGKALGWMELYRSGAGEQAEYFVRSELTRWYGVTLKSAAEQVEQEAPAIIKE